MAHCSLRRRFQRRDIRLKHLEHGARELHWHNQAAVPVWAKYIRAAASDARCDHPKCLCSVRTCNLKGGVNRSQTTPLDGNLFNTNETTVDHLKTEDISYISCDSADHSSPNGALAVVEKAMNHNLTAIILYSTRAQFCGYSGVTKVMQNFPIYSMKSMRSEERRVGKECPV